jgi:hypothetical protein
MKHITTKTLQQVEEDLSPSVLHSRMKEHLLEICRPCKRAFRDHQQRKLNQQPRKRVLEPLHKVTFPPGVTEQVQALRQLSPEQRLAWTETPSAERPETQAALVLALLLEARSAPDTAAATNWPEVAAHFLRINPPTGPAAVPLRILARSYQAEGQRRLGQHLGAARAIREAFHLAETHTVQDQATLAELHFIAGKIATTDRQRRTEAEDHLCKAALLYAALADDAHRAHCLAFQAVASHKVNQSSPTGQTGGRSHPPFLAPVDLVVESLGLLSPEEHARCLLPILLDLAHLYCDRKQFHLAEDLRALLGTLAPQATGPVGRARYQWLQARLATAHGVPEKADERYRACSVTVAEPMLDSLGLLLALRDQAPEP